MKYIIYTVSKNGHKRIIFAPNQYLCSQQIQDLKDGREDIVAVQEVKSDTMYFIQKFKVRTNQLQRTIESYDLVKYDTPFSVREVLLDSIDTQIDILLGMIRRKQKKDYKFDVSNTIQVIENWELRRSY